MKRHKTAIIWLQIPINRLRRCIYLFPFVSEASNQHIFSACIKSKMAMTLLCCRRQGINPKNMPLDIEALNTEKIRGRIIFSRTLFQVSQFPHSSLLPHLSPLVVALLPLPSPLLPLPSHPERQTLPVQP